MQKKIKSIYQLQRVFNSYYLLYKPLWYPFKWYVDVIFKRWFYTDNLKK